MDETSEPTHVRGIGAFGMIPEWLLLAPISSTAKVVFGWMACRYASRTTWACWPGQTRLAADLGLSVSTISGCIRELVQVGAVTKRQRVDAAGAPATNYYQLMFLPSPEKLGLPEKTEAPLPQKTEGTLPQKTASKPEVLEPEVLEPEVPAQVQFRPAPLVETPIQWHRRHGAHVAELCAWVCLPQELATQFANRAGLGDHEVIAWARSVKEQWQAQKRIPVGSMYDFWNRRWTERQANQNAIHLTPRLASHQMAQEHAQTEKAQREARQRDEARQEMQRIQALKDEVWSEQQQRN